MHTLRVRSSLSARKLGSGGGRLICVHKAIDPGQQDSVLSLCRLIWTSRSRPRRSRRGDLQRLGRVDRPQRVRNPGRPERGCRIRGRARLVYHHGARRSRALDRRRAAAEQAVRRSPAPDGLWVSPTTRACSSLLTAVNVACGPTTAPCSPAEKYLPRPLPWLLKRGVADVTGRYSSGFSLAATLKPFDDAQARAVGYLAAHASASDVVDVTVVEGALPSRPGGHLGSRRPPSHRHCDRSPSRGRTTLTLEQNSNTFSARLPHPV